jgi:polyhydroxybutyrate depolymerase
MRKNALRVLAVALAASIPGHALDSRQVAPRASAVAEPVRTVALTFQGRIRRYLLHVPAAPTGALVLAFHGGGQFASQMREISGLDAVADREQFIVAYPEAFERSWADGRNTTAAERQGVDDVAFAKAVVADIAKAYGIDRSRVYATGLSNGGMFSHRLACEATDTFVAIAPVAAAMATIVTGSCRPSAPVAVVAIQGVADTSVPFDGGGPLQGSRATEGLWRSLNGCSSMVTVTPLPTTVQDGTSVVRRSYGNCRDNADVVWYEIQGGGHRWTPPDRDADNEVRAHRQNGAASQNINTSDVIWAFFAAHARE